MERKWYNILIIDHWKTTNTVTIPHNPIIYKGVVNHTFFLKRWGAVNKGKKVEIITHIMLSGQ